MYEPPEILLREIVEKYQGQISDLISVPDYIWNDSQVHANRYTKHSIEGTSIEDGQTIVSASLHAADMTYLGSFDLDAGAMQVSAIINAYTDNDSGRRTRISPAEEEAWARALLGTRYSDYAYRVNIVRGALRPWFQPFTVFVDRQGAPMLAPKDFDWNKAWGFSTPQKLAPEPVNRDLVDQLLRNGPYADTSGLHKLPSNNQWRLLFIIGVALKLAQLNRHNISITNMVYEDHILRIAYSRRNGDSKTSAQFTVDVESARRLAENRSPEVSGMNWLSQQVGVESQNG